jgi:hypothetical protein
LISQLINVYAFLLRVIIDCRFKSIPAFLGGIMKINRLFTLSFTICALIVFWGTTAFGLDMNEGDWEVTMETAMQGMPYAMPPMVFKSTQCTTKDDLAPSNKNNKNCDVKDQRVVGNTFYWKVICVDKDGRTEGDGKITYSGNNYKGTINMKVTDKKGAVMTMLTKLSGRYLGPCSAATKSEAERRKALSKK